jgi:hypothetical protein
MILLALLGCPDHGPQAHEPAPADLVTPLGPGEVRAGVITDERALFGGISAEGRAGDVKIYNDRVQFVIQAARPGDWYLVEGGGVIDADIVRPAGQLGHDSVEEWSGMYGLGRICVPETVEVVDDGADGDAVVRVTGYEAPLGLLTGALESTGFIPDDKLEMTVEYRLRPDSWLLEVTSTATATTLPATFAIGDLLIGADETLSPWAPGQGMDLSSTNERTWSGYQADRNDVALILAAPPDAQLQTAGYDVLTALASMAVGFAPTVTIQPGESTSWTRYYGVGPDLATLSAAVLQERGDPTQEVSGTVTAPDGPVAGARVVVDVDGAPYTVAVTGADGSFATTVPMGTTSTLVDGRGPGWFVDLPDGASPNSPYAADVVEDAMIAGLQGGAVPVPLAQGRGYAEGLTLGQPATLRVRSDDGGPFTVRVNFTGPDVPSDPARVLGRPDGLAAAGWARDGDVGLLVEPGTYDVVVHRGPRYELSEQQVVLTAGQTTEITASLPEAFAHDGWVLGDPHSHGSPSTDTAIPMEDRLIVTAGVGLQVHFGTDHDHLADYRPLVAPLGLDGRIRSVVADEVSPPMRGHFNIYPVEPVPGQPDNGAWEWWAELPESTDWMVDRLREQNGPDFVLQSNHPTGSGMGSSAGWSEGHVSRGSFWTDRIEAVEVLNSGDVDSYLPFWADLVTRGQVVTPVGVSDSHSWTGGHVGWSATWLKVGEDEGPAVTDDEIRTAIRSGWTEPMRGPFLALSADPGDAIAPGGTLSVEARSASWVKVDRLELWRDGALDQVVAGTSATFTLDPDQDAIYWVIAAGDQPMLPVTYDTPWALGGPWRVDVGGDGWTAPKPPLVIEP